MSCGSRGPRGRIDQARTSVNTLLSSHHSSTYQLPHLRHLPHKQITHTILHKRRTQAFCHTPGAHDIVEGEEFPGFVGVQPQAAHEEGMHDCEEVGIFAGEADVGGCEGRVLRKSQ